jgi:glycosyltransferase involved in cell wall biosynthesis
LLQPNRSGRLPVLKLSWPFLGITDAAKQSLGWCILSGPLRQPTDLETYRRLRRRFRFVGFTSYAAFPCIEEGVVRECEPLCEGWCHCFDDPGRYLSASTPRAMISESDFVDPAQLSPEHMPANGLGKDFDFIYVCLPGRWKEATKNWLLAKRCLEYLCLDLNLKGLLLGRWQILDLPFRQNLTIVGDVPHDQLIGYLHRSRMLFVPSVMDASPRILAEALCMDVPILVNQGILGGWKYVNDCTGAFFRSEADVARAAKRCLESDLHPRRWFQDNHGPVRSSQKLSRFLSALGPSMEFTGGLRLTRIVQSPDGLTSG